MLFRCTNFKELLSADVADSLRPTVCKYQKCRRRFIPRRRWQKFCSLGCHDNFWRNIRQLVAERIKKEMEGDQREI